MSKLNIEIVNIVNDIGVDVYQDISRVNVEINQVGIAGSDGIGVPVGGDTGQVLAKKTAANYDTEWIDAAEISVPDATTLIKGIVQLAGDLTGTAEAPLVADGAITDIKVASGIDKAKVGLANVDNTSDLDKPVSTLTQSALDLKAPLDSPAFTGTVTGIDKTMVGLANVDNTSDLDKPVSTLTQSALDLKAPIDQPVFTGGVTSESYAVTNYTGHRLLLDDGNLLEPNLVEETYFLSSTGAGDPLGNTPVWIDISNLYVPYTGATGNINLDIHTITASGVTVTALTVSKLVATDVANNLVSLATDTYPSLDEISYVKGVTSAIQTQLGTKENTANKSTTTTLGTSNTLFPTQNAVKTYVDTQITSATPDATTLVKGKVQLAGDLAGTAALPVIGNGKVTYAKIQNVSATDVVLGRVSVGAGVVEEIHTTGSGNVVRATSPILVTPNIGIATGNSLNVSGNIQNTGGSIFAFGVIGSIISQGSTVGTARIVGVNNQESTNALSSSVLRAQVGGASAGDPYLELIITSGATYTKRLDNSDSDKLVEAFNSAGTTPFRVTTQGGQTTMPLQSSFSAYKSAVTADVTGDSTSYTVISNTEIYDQNSDYNNATGVFTAPVTGRYMFTCNAMLQTISGNYAVLRLVTSNRTYTIANVNTTSADPAGDLVLNGNVIADMDAGDTATMVVITVGGAKTTDVYGGASPVTFFQGYLIH